MDDEIRTIVGHSCRLKPLTNDDIIAQRISAGYFVNFRRSFRRLCSISETNLLGRRIFRSTAQVHEERMRHLKHHYYMIHPFSDLRAKWENLMIVVYILLMTIFVPLELSFITRTPRIIMLTKFGLDVVTYVNIVMTFFVGYVKSSEKVVLGAKDVAKWYLFNGMFFVDVLSSIPVTFIMYQMDRRNLWRWKGLFFLKIFQIRSVITLVNNYIIREQYWYRTLRPMRLFLRFYLAIIWLIVLVHYLETVFLGEKKLSTLPFLKVHIYMVKVCTRVIECLLLVGPEPMSDNSTWLNKLLACSFIILGAWFNIVIFSKIVSMYKSRNTARNKHMERLKQIEQYIKYKQVPPHLQTKVRRYVDFKNSRRLVTENDLLGNLSNTLREDIMYQKSQTLIQRVEFFKDLPQQLIMRLVSKLKTELYLKKEVIYDAGSASNCMYFVIVGGVAVYAENGKEIFRFSEGKHFGEVPMLTNKPHRLMAVATSDCELSVLRRSDFLQILKPYPEIRSKIRQDASVKKSIIKRLLERTGPL